ERITVRATGTEYAVALRPHDVMVSVVEGAVEVRDAAGQSKEMLKATQLLTVARGTRVRAIRQDAEARSVAWVRGKLDVDGQRLREVVEELNHYIERPIVISDHELGDLPVSGVFDPRRPDSFLEALTQLRPVVIERTPDGGRRIARRQ